MLRSQKNSKIMFCNRFPYFAYLFHTIEKPLIEIFQSSGFKKKHIVCESFYIFI